MDDGLSTPPTPPHQPLSHSHGASSAASPSNRRLSTSPAPAGGGSASVIPMNEKGRPRSTSSSRSSISKGSGAPAGGDATIVTGGSGNISPRGRRASSRSRRRVSSASSSASNRSRGSSVAAASVSSSAASGSLRSPAVIPLIATDGALPPFGDTLSPRHSSLPTGMTQAAASQPSTTAPPRKSQNGKFVWSESLDVIENLYDALKLDTSRKYRVLQMYRDAFTEECYVINKNREHQGTFWILVLGGPTLIVYLLANLYGAGSFQDDTLPPSLRARVSVIWILFSFLVVILLGVLIWYVVALLGSRSDLKAVRRRGYLQDIAFPIVLGLGLCGLAAPFSTRQQACAYRRRAEGDSFQYECFRVYDATVCFVAFIYAAVTRGRVLTSIIFFASATVAWSWSIFGAKEPTLVPADTVLQGVECSVMVLVVCANLSISIINELLLRERFETEVVVRQNIARTANATTEINNLIRNLMPETVMQRVLAGSPVLDSGPATVTISDLAGFTLWCAKRSSAEAVEMLSTLVDAIDATAAANVQTKVKTLGDAYWAVCGLPIAVNDHGAIALVFAAKCHKIAKMISKRNRRYGSLEFRTGVHTDRMVAGVLGTSRLAYEVYGVASSVATELEEACRVGHILISERTARGIGNQRLRSFLMSSECTIDTTVGPLGAVQLKPKEVLSLLLPTVRDHIVKLHQQRGTEMALHHAASFQFDHLDCSASNSASLPGDGSQRSSRSGSISSPIFNVVTEFRSQFRVPRKRRNTNPHLGTGVRRTSTTSIDVVVTGGGGAGGVGMVSPSSSIAAEPVTHLNHLPGNPMEETPAAEVGSGHAADDEKDAKLSAEYSEDTAKLSSIFGNGVVDWEGSAQFHQSGGVFHLAFDDEDTEAEFNDFYVRVQTFKERTIALCFIFGYLLIIFCALGLLDREHEYLYFQSALGVNLVIFTGLLFMFVARRSTELEAFTFFIGFVTLSTQLFGAMSKGSILSYQNGHCLILCTGAAFAGLGFSKSLLVTTIAGFWLLLVAVALGRIHIFDAFTVMSVILFSLAAHTREKLSRYTFVASKISQLALEAADWELNALTTVTSRLLPTHVVPPLTAEMRKHPSLRESIAFDFKSAVVLFVRFDWGLAVQLSATDDNDGGGRIGDEVGWGVPHEEDAEYVRVCSGLIDAVEYVLPSSASSAPPSPSHNMLGMDDSTASATPASQQRRTTSNSFEMISKVKTIGDTILFAGSLDPQHASYVSPKEQQEACETFVRFFFVLRKAVHQLMPKEPIVASGGLCLGPLTAAVIGRHQLIYDIFGTTVNLAARVMATVPSAAAKQKGAMLHTTADVATTLKENMLSQSHRGGGRMSYGSPSRAPPLVVGPAQEYRLKGVGMMAVSSISLQEPKGRGGGQERGVMRADSSWD